MNTTGVDPFFTIVFSIVIFILVLFGIGDFEFGPFIQEVPLPFF